MATLILFCPECREERQLDVTNGRQITQLPCEHFLTVWTENSPMHKKIWVDQHGRLWKELLSKRAAQRKMKRLNEMRLVEGESRNQYGTPIGLNLY